MGSSTETRRRAGAAGAGGVVASGIREENKAGSIPFFLGIPAPEEQCLHHAKNSEQVMPCLRKGLTVPEGSHA